MKEVAEYIAALFNQKGGDEASPFLLPLRS